MAIQVRHPSFGTFTFEHGKGWSGGDPESPVLRTLNRKRYGHPEQPAEFVEREAAFFALRSLPSGACIVREDEPLLPGQSSPSAGTGNAPATGSAGE